MIHEGDCGVIGEANDDWQGKPKYSEKTCPSATLFHYKSHMIRSGFEPRTTVMGSQRLTAWAMARPQIWVTGQHHASIALSSKTKFLNFHKSNPGPAARSHHSSQFVLHVGLLYLDVFLKIKCPCPTNEYPPKSLLKYEPSKSEHTQSCLT
jgi:hypothetical protein